MRVGRKAAIAAVVAVVAVAAAGVAGWTVLWSVETATSTADTSPTAVRGELVTTPPAEPPGPAEALSTVVDDGQDQCRSDRGDQKTGAGVIAAFEHAYYVRRSGAAARTLVAPDSPLPAAEKIQAGIDTVPFGTNYCLRTVPITEGHYSVVLSEMRPGQQASQFTQTIITKQVDGHWFVDVIT